jgi:hypothetical protein
LFTPSSTTRISLNGSRSQIRINKVKIKMLYSINGGKGFFIKNSMKTFFVVIFLVKGFLYKTEAAKPITYMHKRVKERLIFVKKYTAVFVGVIKVKVSQRKPKAKAE